MADKTFLDEEDQIDLELDVVFNEFEEELQQSDEKDIGNLPKQNSRTLNTTCSAEHLAKSCVDDNKESRLSKEGLSLGITNEEKTHKESSKDEDEEEGEILTQEEEEMQLLMDDTEDTNAKDGQNSSSLDQKKENLKRKMDSNDVVLDEVADMDIVENLLLEFDEESLVQEKKCKKEEDGSSEVSQDVVMKKTRGGKKKKKKKYRGAPVHYGRIPRPIIGRLFRPLVATEHDEPEVLAGQLADRLEEEKEDLILQVVKTIGSKKTIELFQETKKIQVEGGMSTVYGNRRRTSGGIFFFLLKNKGYATKEQLKDIFAAEREKVKQLIKEQKQRDKELREKGIHDLRQKLGGKRETETEDNKSKNKNASEVSKSEESTAVDLE